MAVLARRVNERHFGLRPMDPMRDLGGVADLIERAFVNDLDQSGQSALRDLRWLSRLKPVLWWMVYANPEHTDFLSGFVWEEDNKIVGNITINRSSPTSRRWLISNVAVAEGYRRRGIAKGLMYAALELVKEYNGSVASLQVRANNEGAKQLYQTLQFKEIAGTTYLWAQQVPRAPVYSLPKNVILRARNYDIKDSRDAYTLACAATPLISQQEWPLRQNQFRLRRNNFLNSFFSWLNGGGSSVHWVIEDGQRFVGLINISPGGFGKRHHIELMVHPDWRTILEKPLLSRALEYLSKWPNRAVFVRHPSYHSEAIEVYKMLGFQEQQTLIWMKRDM